MQYQTRSKETTGTFKQIQMRSDDAYYCYLRAIPFSKHLEAQIELGPNPYNYQVLNFINTLSYQDPEVFEFYSTNRVDASLVGLQAHVTFTSLEEGLPPTELLNLLPMFARIGYKVTPLNVVHAAKTTTSTLSPRDLLWILIAFALCYWTVQPQSHQIVTTTQLYHEYRRTHTLEIAQENMILQFANFPLPLHLIATATNTSAAQVYDFLISRPPGTPTYLDTYSYCWTRAFPSHKRVEIALNYPGFVTYPQLLWIYLTNPDWQPASLTPGHLSFARTNVAPIQLPILIFLEQWFKYCALRFIFSRTIPTRNFLTGILILVAVYSTGYLVSIF